MEVKNINTNKGQERIKSLIFAINDLQGSEKAMKISALKNNLSNLTIEDISTIVEYLHSHQKEEIVSERILPQLCNGLNNESIIGLLQTLNNNYTNEVDLDLNRKSLIEKQKESTIKCLKELNNNDLLHKRLILGLYLALNHNSSTNISIENFEKNFLHNINTWLFGINGQVLWHNIEAPTDLVSQNKKEITEILNQ